MALNTRAVGKTNEELAAEYLRGRGFEIAEMNYRTRSAEIDIVAMDGSVIVFVEVKYRSGSGCGSPLASVDVRKQRRISRAALTYLVTHGYSDSVPCRFDVIGITPGGISHIEQAFEFIR